MKNLVLLAIVLISCCFVTITESKCLANLPESTPVPGDCSSYPTAKFLSQKDQRITYSFRTMPVSNDSPCIRGTPKCEVADPATCGQLSLHYITTSGESKAFDTLNNQSITEFLACQSDGLWGTTAAEKFTELWCECSLNP